MATPQPLRLSRRTLLRQLGATGVLVTLGPAGAWAAQEAVQQAVRERIGTREPQPGGVALRLPKIAETGNSVPLTVTVESPMTPDDHVLRLHAPSYPYESEALLALTTFVALQSCGLPIDVRIDGPAQPFFEAGKALYKQRRGQLDLACTHCHDHYAGQRLRGDIISQGQINGFPIYRHTWQSLGSTHRMFAWCNTAVRAEPYPPGSDAYVNLELFVAWRGRGLPGETPAVRR